MKVNFTIAGGMEDILFGPLDWLQELIGKVKARRQYWSKKKSPSAWEVGYEPRDIAGIFRFVEVCLWALWFVVFGIVFTIACVIGFFRKILRI